MTKCPENWEYKDLPGWQQVLFSYQVGLLESGLTGFAFDDTRPIHGQMFKLLTPRGFPQYAGHYRGEPLRCIERLHVRLVAPGGGVSDDQVGMPPSDVLSSMTFLGGLFKEAIDELDVKMGLVSNGDLSEKLFLYSVAAAAADMMQRFLTVHPYANGNGHIARLVVLALLCRYGYRPLEWTIEPRPSEQYYRDDLIFQHRRGQQTPLIRAILTMLKSQATARAAE